MAKPGLFSRMFSRGSDDAGRGDLDDYDYNLRPKNKDVVIRLSDSNQNQDDLQRAFDSEAEVISAMISRRSVEDERVDAPMPVRLFFDGRVSGIVGVIPRGLEAPVDDALGRLSESGKAPRIPVSVTRSKGGLRADLLIGSTR